MREGACWSLETASALSGECSLRQKPGRKVMRGPGPVEVVGTLEDAAAYGMGNTRRNKAQEQDQLVLAGMTEAA